MQANLYFLYYDIVQQETYTNCSKNINQPVLDSVSLGMMKNKSRNLSLPSYLSSVGLKYVQLIDGQTEFAEIYV